MLIEMLPGLELLRSEVEDLIEHAIAALDRADGDVEAELETDEEDFRRYPKKLPDDE